MTPAAQEELLERMYAAFNAREVEVALASMHPDVDWPNGMEGGRVRGHTAVRDYWMRQWAIIDPHVEPQRFMVEADGRIAVEVHQIVRDLTSKVVKDGIVHHVYEFEGNLIKSMEIR